MQQLNARPVAIVTGACRGIGRACALGLAKAGFNLLLNDLAPIEGDDSASRLRLDIADLGMESELILGDIARLELHRSLIETALARWGRIDCLLNNAGVSVQRRGDLLEVTPDSFDSCIAVNTRAVFFLCQAVARQMLASEGDRDAHRSIVNITSSNVKAVSINRGEYCVSKAASSMTTKLFALRLAKAGIGVYEVRPGLIATEMHCLTKQDTTN